MRMAASLKLLTFIVPFAFLVPVTIALAPDLNKIWNSEALQNIKTVFVSIFLEAAPFLLMGVLLSSLMQWFVSEEMVRRLTPKHPVGGVLVAGLLGLIFPICECGMIPVVRRLMHKGMPAYIAVTFILSGPVVNPIVFTATLLAFPNHPEITVARMGLAFAVAAAVGGLVYLFVKHNPLRIPNVAAVEVKTHPGFRMASSPSQQTTDAHQHHHTHPKSWRSFFIHAGDEFVDMSKYLVIGALITACIQTFVSRSDLISLGNGPVASYVFMMGFAYVLSLCSTSDAFVASAFSHTFALGPLISFLVLGPMLDLKSTLMLLSTFRTRFVIGVCLAIVFFVFAGSWLVNFLG
ncbi:Putative two-component membrane permease complex subunit SMU_747c [Paenibacillus sp. JJ-100]|uniref:permease n=1 Tax=Paenibacillus sp. JJ-100 TaxID=2974896 RepID=UPI0022FFA001|nr:permease [Paenibacillus sp. JJ-100]CAI6051331.1 Putative two-component membrane permease complex subunit SMU_747c [Paenibacillus sp. JJ-100]